MARTKLGEIKVDASGARALARAVSRALRPPVVTEAVRAALQVYQQGIQARAPRKSGRLAESFKVTTTGGLSGEVSSDLVYARPQEVGAYIAPKNKKTLHFSGPQGPVFLRRGIRLKPQPYVEPTFESDSPRATEAFVREIERGFEI